ncbi:MAG: tRNA (adenosine(37)-N6)-threonylcarbamoyltransferase complex dimerization subunit type 1 TsaB [Verrucomicrobia bacterium]|nr:tRNA (adenosine(37)-N6)-threonylcarbamoyltransferase complex dimerization subunit type 1 TsaB [Verrucomicrobiota bacterium]
MITLALDTSTARGSVALLRDDETMAEQTFSRAGSGDGLFDAIAAVLGDVVPDLIAVGLGPGSFTGIRAGIAAARGLALPGRTPLKGVSSFDALALTALPQMPSGAPAMCVLADARRGEVYSALYGRDGKPLRECRVSAREQVGEGTAWIVSADVTPGASALGRLARAQFLADGGRGDERLDPVYLRATAYRRCADSTGSAGAGMLTP